MAIEVAGVVARLGFRVDDDGAQRFERKVRDLRGDAKRDVVVPLRGDIQGKDLDLYEKKLAEIRARVKRREDFRAQLGADFDPKAFNAFEREQRRAIRTTDDNVKATGKLRTAFGTVYGRGGAVFAAAGGLYGVVKAGEAVIGTANDINESLSKNKVLFGNSAQVLDRYSKRTAESIGVSRAAALDAAGAFGSLFESIGLADKPAERMSRRLVTLAADLASFHNASPEEALEALRSGLAGEAEPLRRFGALLSETRVQAEAVATGIGKANVEVTKVRSAHVHAEEALKNYNDAVRENGKDSLEARKAQAALGLARKAERDALKGGKVDLTEAQKAQARYSLILKDTAAAHGDARKTGDQYAGQMRRLRAQISDLSGEIGKNLLPVARDVADWLNEFIKGMRNGSGEGGKFVDRLKEIWDRLVGVYEALRDANRWLENFYTKVGRGAKRTADDLLGLASTIIGAFADIASAGAKVKIPGMKGIAEDLRETQHELDKTREGLRKTADTADRVDMKKVRKENRQTAQAFRDMAKDGGGSMRDIARTVDRRSRDIRSDLSGRSEEGRKALADNFMAAIRAVRRQMDNGKVATRDGMKAIRGYLSDYLRVYGMSIAEGQKLVGNTNPTPSNVPQLAPTPNRKAGGGWIGAPGQVGQDSVPALLAPGEAVLNRHQQAVVEGMLGSGFLDRLFSRVQTPHYMARGGIVPVPGFPGESAAQSVIPKILQIARQFGLTLTDAFGAGHKSPGHTRFGTAADFAGPDRRMDAAVRSLVAAGYTVGYDGRFGSAAWPGHGPSYVAGSNAHLHVELGGKGGAISVPEIARRIVRGGGAVGAAVQASLDTARAGAQSFLERATAGSLTMPVGGGGGGAWSKSRLAGLWRAVNRGLGDPNLMAAIALAESGGQAGIVNSIGAGGLWQIHPPVAGYLDPRTNARLAGGKLRTQGLRAWEAYTNGSYRQFLARGGRAVQRFAGGGKAGFLASQGATSVAAAGAENRAAQGFALRAPRRALAHRIAEYEGNMSAVERVRKQYAIEERRYNRIDEGSLVDEKTGAVNVEAVQEKASHIWQMIVFAGQIVHYLEEAQKVARRVVNSYTAIVNRLRRSLRHAKKKDRSGIRSQIADAVSGRDEYQGIVGDLGFDITNARMDWEDLGKERDELLATKGSPPDADTSGDSGSGGSDDGDAQAIADQAQARADAALKDLAAVRANFAAFTSTGDIGSAQGTSALGSTLVDAAGGVGGAIGAGVAGGFIAGAGSTVIVNNFESLVPYSHAEAVRVSDVMVTSLSARPVRPPTSATVG